MLSYVEPKDDAVVVGEERHEIVYAKDQPQFKPLRTLVEDRDEGGVLSRWSPTPEQRQAIAEGKDIYLELLCYHGPLTPILMFVAGDEDAEEIKAAFWPVVTPA